MNKLEKLTQEESGRLHRADGQEIRMGYALPVGKIRAIVVANPCFDISQVIDKMVERNSACIPKEANAYVASDFSGDTQHLRKSNSGGDEKFYSVFALQFYYV
jgi:hypothetical protein